MRTGPWVPPGAAHVGLCWASRPGMALTSRHGQHHRPAGAPHPRQVRPSRRQEVGCGRTQCRPQSRRTAASVQGSRGLAGRPQAPGRQWLLDARGQTLLSARMAAAGTVPSSAIHGASACSWGDALRSGSRTLTSLQVSGPVVLTPLSPELNTDTPTTALPPGQLEVSQINSERKSHWCPGLTDKNVGQGRPRDPSDAQGPQRGPASSFLSMKFLMVPTGSQPLNAMALKSWVPSPVTGPVSGGWGHLPADLLEAAAQKPWPSCGGQETKMSPKSKRPCRARRV